MLANGGGQDVVITLIYFRLKDWAKKVRPYQKFTFVLLRDMFLPSFHGRGIRKKILSPHEVSECLTFVSSWGLRIFSCPTIVTRRLNTSSSISFPSSKLTIFLILFTKHIVIVFQIMDPNTWPNGCSLSWDASVQCALELYSTPWKKSNKRSK